MARKKQTAPKTRRSGERAGVTVAAGVDLAVDRADRGEDVSLAGIAAALGIKTPSLHTHVSSLDHLRRLMKVRALEQFLAATTDAALGRAGKHALFAVCDAQRAFAKAHPGLVPFTESVDADDDERGRAAGAGLVACLGAVLRGYGIEGDDALHATRLLRAATSGVIALETNGGFGMPLEIDESWRRLKELLHAGMASGSTSTS